MLPFTSWSNPWRRTLGLAGRPPIKKSKGGALDRPSICLGWNARERIMENDKTILQNKQVFVGAIEVRYSNPNGEREGSKAPRYDAATGIGQITDVCIKRKIREALHILYNLPLYVDNDRALNTKMLDAARACGALDEVLAGQKALDVGEDPAKVEKAQLDLVANAVKKDPELLNRIFQNMLETYPDLRAFGGVLAKLNRSILGPVQIAMAQSVSPIEIMTLTITRKAIATEEKYYDDGANTMLGEKVVVPYGLYIFKGEISAVEAANTAFTEEYKERFFNAMKYMFSFDKAAARSDVTLRCLYNFDCGSRLALDAPTWKLWEALEVKPVQDVQDGIRPPRSYEDYTVTLREENIPACVTVNKIL